VPPSKWLCLFILLGACSQGGPTANGFRCSTTGTCPASYRCIDDRCWKGGELPDGQVDQQDVGAPVPLDGPGGDSDPLVDAKASMTFDAPSGDAFARPPDGPHEDSATPSVDAPASADAPAPPQDGAPRLDTGSVRASNGTPCARDQDCESGSCSPDGLCCNTDCTSPCEACNVAGNLGRCTRVPSGQPHGKPACGGSGSCAGSCNGTSAMCVFPASACGTATCSGNVLTKTGTCDGAGSCRPGGTQNCGAFLCTTGGCTSSCSGDGDCATGNYCAGAGGCVATKGNGSTCTSGGQCVSGFCSDQVCCNEACTGACRGCASGSCTVIAGTVDPDTCHTTRFCGTAAYLGSCILGLVLNKDGGLVPDAFYTFLPVFADETAAATFVLTRAPGVSTTTPAVHLTGANVDKFTLNFDQCSGQPLSAGSTCTVQVIFQPGVAGQFSAVLEASDTTGNKTNMALIGKTR
jgi:hypothetical protein